jgi:hypothetical protein
MELDGNAREAVEAHIGKRGGLGIAWQNLALQTSGDDYLQRLRGNWANISVLAALFATIAFAAAVQSPDFNQ